jgi:hypothetical protein
MAKKAKVYTGTEWVDLAAATTDLSQYPNMTTTPISGFRNAIINGDFRINQRGFTSVTANATYGFDRWFLINAGDGTKTYTPNSFAPGNAISGYEPINYARIVNASQTNASVASCLGQRIEDVRTFAGQTITISFWARATSGTPSVAIEFSQRFNSSADVNHTPSKVQISTTWQRYSLATTLPSITGKTIGSNSNLQLYIWTSAGSDYNSRTNTLGIQNNTFEFWGVQVEEGSIATPFEQRPLTVETQLCQRYFQVPQSLQAFYYNASNSSAHVALPVAMRTVPQLAVTGATVFQHTIGIQSGNITPISIGFTNSGTVTGGQVTFNQNATLASMATNTYYIIQAPFFTCSAEL